MEFIGIFDVIGPNMIGPSSSHTAGVVSIALMARNMFSYPVSEAEYTLYGSFAHTYKGHGTDRALLGGTLGFSTDDLRIRDAFKLADHQGLKYRFIINETAKTSHPNTVDIRLKSPNGHAIEVRGVSVGGGKIKITRIDGIDVEFTGEYSTLIVKHQDSPGVVAHIAQALSDRGINIAFMRLFREAKGASAYTIVESDEPVSPEVCDDIRSQEHVHDIMLINVQ